MSAKRASLGKVKATDEVSKVNDEADGVHETGNQSETAMKTTGEGDVNTTTQNSGRVTRAKKLRDDGRKTRKRKQREVDNGTEDEKNDQPNDNARDKDSETDEAEETCFKIDKVYSVADENNAIKTDGVKIDETKQKAVIKETEVKPAAVSAFVLGHLDNKGLVMKDDSKLKDEKQIKPRLQTASAKVPVLAGGLGSVRMLGGGMHGTNMPFIVSMGAGNPGIPLLPAGLPPGRYVILPGTSTTTKNTATVTTMSSGHAPRLVTTAAAGQSIVTAPKVLATTTPAAATVTPHVPPQIPGGSRLFTRERGRRKSYTTGEKLAMIEAVEGGQRKSLVADRFGVAPSTLACILAQRHKIRSEKDNLARRRVRHGRYQMREEQGVSSLSPLSSPPLTHVHPFTHFLAPLTGSPAPPSLMDAQPEEIIAVPDLVDRLSSSIQGVSCKGESMGDLDDDDDDDLDGGVMEQEPAIEPDMVVQQEHHHHPSTRTLKTKTSSSHRSDVGDEQMTRDGQGRTPSPSHNTTGLVGPYLLKKETHCTTVLDQLMRDDTYTDVTLTAEGQSLRAHRIVLCLASSYFRQVLSREMSVQSVIVLRDVKFAELRNIIHFIYTGEATVDASELESFMRTAELLEISSLCEGQKCITGRGPSTQNSFTSSFSISDFERLVGTKRSRREASPTSTKSRKLSGEGQASRCSSTEPTANSNSSLSFVKEEPDFDDSSSFQVDPLKTITEPSQFLKTNSSAKTGSEERTRRDSSSSVGGFAAIAGVQKASEGEEGIDDGGEENNEVFSPPPPQGTSPSPTPQPPTQSPIPTTVTPDVAVPGRCPYCPHISHNFEGVSMMRHLLVSHPCKPAFPCDTCWRVFVKRSAFKGHQGSCQQSPS